ncbi:MAG TPA: RHS repeat-associated core domain-containing protein [Candidatus Sulfotelmatobacter sp.]
MVRTRVTFKYDPFGRRIYKSSSAGTSIFAYDEDNLIEETNASGAVVARYTQTEQTDEPLAMLRSSTTSYYQADDLGSLSSLSNAAGALAQTYTFDSFGNQTASSGSLTNSFRYTGRDFDTETNLYFYRARYYDPNAGRFLSEDPFGIRDNVDMYVYVRNNPVNFNDPFGLYKLKGYFPPGYGAQLSNAIDDVIKKLRDPCASGGCVGAEGPKIANALDGATFVYHPKSKYCGDVGPFSVVRLHHVVALGPPAFDPSSGCGPLTCTVAHEGVHLRTGTEPHGDRVGKCFGCTN